MSISRSANTSIIGCYLPHNDGTRDSIEKRENDLAKLTELFYEEEMEKRDV